MSTPAGKRGWWWQAWTSGGARWERIEIPWQQCPRISPVFIAEETLEHGLAYVQQEYCCQFGEADGSLLLLDEIAGAVNSEVKAVNMMQSIYRKRVLTNATK